MMGNPSSLKGIVGIKGFADKIETQRIRYTNNMFFPNESAIGRWFQNVITVGKSGEMFAEIQQAIDAIKNAVSEANPAVLAISSGEYEEAITLPGWIHLMPIGPVAIKSSGDEPAITVSGTSTWFHHLTLLPAIGSSAAILCSNATLVASRLTALRGLDADGLSILKFQDSNVGQIEHLDSEDFTLWLTNTIVVGDIIKGLGGEASFWFTTSAIWGQVNLSDCTQKIRCQHTGIFDILGRPLISLYPGNAESYVRLQSSTLSTDIAENTIENGAGAGTVEIWSTHNALSSGFGSGVNENIGAPGNTVDTEIAKFRLS